MLDFVNKKVSVFLADEKGAVTVDFVVLTAGAVLIALTAGAILKTEAESATNSITIPVDVLPD